MSEENSKSENWGGYRENSGRPPKWLSGPTEAVRLPKDLVPIIRQLAAEMDRLRASGKSVEQIKQMVRIEQSLSDLEN